MNAAMSSAALTEQLLAMQMDDEGPERPGTTMTRASSFRGSEIGGETTARPGSTRSVCVCVFSSQ
jgi:hypothetical protein